MTERSNSTDHEAKMTTVAVLKVSVIRDRETNQVSIKLDSAAPWVDLTGMTVVGETFRWDERNRGGAFKAKGMGGVDPVRSTPPIPNQ